MDCKFEITMSITDILLNPAYYATLYIAVVVLAATFRRIAKKKGWFPFRKKS